MNYHKYYILDVFAMEKYTGNQLAVVILNNKIEDSEMQKIANEFHFSETAFILSNDKNNGGYDVRIFTPLNEVPFAGHPTLGSAFIIKNKIQNENEEKIILNLKIGQITVKFEKNNNTEIFRMKQINPIFDKIHDIKNISGILGLDESDIDNRYPIQEVSTGIQFLIIPLMNLKAVKNAKTIIARYNDYFNNNNARPFFIFSPETYQKDNQINARMFADIFGIPEDPATGSANGCLAGYLAKYKYFGSNKINIRVEQGFEISRDSIIFINAEKKEDIIDVYVGGMVFLVAEGILY